MDASFTRRRDINGPSEGRGRAVVPDVHHETSRLFRLQDPRIFEYRASRVGVTGTMKALSALFWAFLGFGQWVVVFL